MDDSMLMKHLLEFKIYQPSIIKTVTIDAKQYEVVIQGKGKIAVLAVGGALLMQRTLSPKFKELVIFYACDLYWLNKFRLEDPSLFLSIKLSMIFYQSLINWG